MLEHLFTSITLEPIIKILNKIKSLSYSIFSIFTTVRLTSTTLHTPLWTSIIYVGTNYLVLYGYLYGATAFNGYYIITSITLTGWQYVGCYDYNFGK